MVEKFNRYDAADYLETEEDICLYLEACQEEGNPALVAAALGDIARARNMTQLRPRRKIPPVPPLEACRKRQIVGRRPRCWVTVRRPRPWVVGHRLLRAFQSGASFAARELSFGPKVIVAAK